MAGDLLPGLSSRRMSLAPLPGFTGPGRLSYFDLKKSEG
jgi:hypothetical protein